MLMLLRLALVLGTAALVVLAVMRRHQTVRMLKAFLFEPSSPVNIALLRILIFGAILKVAWRSDAYWYAGLPKELRNPPFGWGWLRDLPLYEPSVMVWAQYILVVASACATFGLFTRVSVATAVFVAVMGQAVTMFFEKVNHGNHAGMLCALALVFAPCGDALSLDRLGRWWRGQAAPAASAVYGLPMRVSWLLLATTYLFPGVWKLWLSGDQWITGERLEATMQRRWESLQTFAPPMRVDEYPVLMALLGIATLVFEIAFIFALFNRVARVIVAFSAVGFHLGVKSFMGIPFPPYLPLILLLDFPQLTDLAGRVLPERIRTKIFVWRDRLAAAPAQLRSRLRPEGPERPHPVRAIRPVMLVGILLFSGQWIFGTFHISSWPISVFPTFRGRMGKAPSTGTDIRIEYEASDGTKRDLRKTLKRMGPARLQNLFKVLTPVEEERVARGIVGLFKYAGKMKVKPGDRVAIIRAKWDLYPLGEKTNYRETVERRYEVTKEGSLRLVYNAKHEEKKAREAKAKRRGDTARDAADQENQAGSPSN